MIEIPVESTPSQRLLATLEGQNCEISVYQRGDNMYVDLVSDGVDVCRGAVFLPTVKIPQVATTFDGALFVIDYQSDPPHQYVPQWRDLGSRYRVYFLSSDEVAYLEAEKWEDALAEVAYG